MGSLVLYQAKGPFISEPYSMNSSKKRTHCENQIHIHIPIYSMPSPGIILIENIPLRKG